MTDKHTSQSGGATVTYVFKPVFLLNAERLKEARASVALDAETQHCTHTTDGTICDKCMGREASE